MMGGLGMWCVLRKKDGCGVDQYGGVTVKRKRKKRVRGEILASYLVGGGWHAGARGTHRTVFTTLTISGKATTSITGLTSLAVNAIQSRPLETTTRATEHLQTSGFSLKAGPPAFP